MTTTNKATIHSLPQAMMRSKLKGKVKDRVIRGARRDVEVGVGGASVVLRVGADPPQTLQVGLARHGRLGEAGVRPNALRRCHLVVGEVAGVRRRAVLVDGAAPVGADTDAEVGVEAGEARSSDGLGAEEGGLGAVEAKAPPTGGVQKGGSADKSFLVDEVRTQRVQLKVSVVPALDGHVADGDREGRFHAAGAVSAVLAVRGCKVLAGAGGRRGASGFLVGVRATAVPSGCALAAL